MKCCVSSVFAQLQLALRPVVQWALVDDLLWRVPAIGQFASKRGDKKAIDSDVLPVLLGLSIPKVSNPWKKKNF